MHPVKKAYYILKLLGPRFVWLRSRLYWGKITGRTRRVFAPRPWETIRLEEITSPGTPTRPGEYARWKCEKSPPFLFPLGRSPMIGDSLRTAAPQRCPPLGERLRLIAEGRCVYFFRTPSPGKVDWHRNPFGPSHGPADKDWFEIPDFVPAQGDIRTLWEPARAAWALDLARARAHGHQIDAAGTLWGWLDSWMQACPPFKGCQWKCGQESSVRMIAVALACWALADDPAFTPQRWLQFARLAWATAYRVAHHIGYALSQKNNHALSEACGLLLVAHLFPEFRESARWEQTGRRVLKRELLRQIYDDGSYVQHSMNYHRVMLHAALLGLRLAELAGRPLEREVYQRLALSVEFLAEMIDPETGSAPNYGNNDGALLLPLNECDCNDFRPAIQAGHYLIHRRRRLPPGPWDEDLLWLFGPQALEAPAERERRPASRAFESGGYYTLRRPQSWAMIRCHSYRDRPAHIDPLHLDLWWRGQNVLCDCGTYRYYTPEQPALEYYFKSIAAHNTVEIDGRDPVELVSRYLWLPWPRASKRWFETGGNALMYFEGQHETYDRPPWRVLHRRAVIGLADDAWVIVDDLLGEDEHRATLRWHMPAVPCDFDMARNLCTLHTPAGRVSLSLSAWPPAALLTTLLRGLDGPQRVQGFAAPCYGERLAIPVLEGTLHTRLPARFVSVLGPAGTGGAVCQPQTDTGPQLWKLSGPVRSFTLKLARPDRSAPRILLEVSEGNPP
jgi:hypothetical protein